MAAFFNNFKSKLVKVMRRVFQLQLDSQRLLFIGSALLFSISDAIKELDGGLTAKIEILIVADFLPATGFGIRFLSKT